MSGSGGKWIRNSKELLAMSFEQRAEGSLMAHREIDASTGCWLWTGAKLSTGHGQIRVRNVGYLVHRLAAHLWLGLDLSNRFVGSRKDRSQVNHKCANASCFNPEHIYVGTQKENINDIDHTQRKRQTHCDNGHEFTPETYIKYKGCLICAKAYRDEYYVKTKAHRMELQRERRARLKAANGVAA